MPVKKSRVYRVDDPDVWQEVERQLRFYLRPYVHLSKEWKEDLTQAVWARLCQYIDRFDPEKATLSTFVQLHTHGAIVDELRSKRMPGSKRSKGFQQSVEFSEEFLHDVGVRRGGMPVYFSHDDELRALERKRQVRQIIPQLTPKQRQFILALFWGNDRAVDVERAMGRGSGAGTHLKKGAFRRIREQFPEDLR